MRHGLLAIGLVLALLGALSAPPGAAVAGGQGTIAGRLTNGTAGGGVPAGAEVVLHVFRGELHDEDRPLRAAADGGFSFDGLETGGEYAYQVTASYAGVPYETEPLRFPPGGAEKRIDLTVYEATDADPGLRVRRVAVILAGVDVGSQTLQAVEMVTLENPSDRAYLPTPSGPAGPMGLLRFPLPPHAGDLRPGPGLESAEIIRVDRGFAVTVPVPPGSKEVLFSYRLPYQPGRMPLSRTMPYPTAELQVLVPSDGPDVESPDLRPAEPLQLGGRSYRLYVARDLPARQQLELVLGGLPGRWPFNLPLDGVPTPVWGGLGAGLALALAVGYARSARRTAPEAAARAADRQALVEAIATLDDAFAAGDLPEETYRTRRAEAKARLVLSAREPGRIPAADGRTVGS